MTDTPSPRTTSRPGRRLVPILLILVLVPAGYLGWNHFLGDKGSASAQGFVEVRRGDIEDLVTATGTLQPRDYVDVGAQVSGQLYRIHVEVGSDVEAGQQLAEIDPTLFMARVDASRAQLRFQQAQLRDREAQLSLAESQHRRQRNLLDEDATTLESVQNAEAALRSAHAQIDMLKAQIDQTESTLRADEANLNFARIFAPMDGTVVSINARQGQTLNANQQAPVILRIADLSTMTVQTQVSEADVPRLRIGMPAYFTTLGSRERRWHGTLARIEPTPEVQNNVVLYNAVFEVDNQNRELMTQMTAQVFFVVAEARGVLLAPLAALTMERARGDGMPRRATAQVLDDQGRVQAREVEVGVSNRIQAQILSGLEEGDRLLPGQANGAGMAQAGVTRQPRLR